MSVTYSRESFSLGTCSFLKGMLSCAHPTNVLETHNLMLGVTGSQLERNVPTADYTI